MYKAKINLSVALANGEMAQFVAGELYTKEQVESCDLENFELVDGATEAAAPAEAEAPAENTEADTTATDTTADEVADEKQPEAEGEKIADEAPAEAEEVLE